MGRKKHSFQCTDHESFSVSEVRENSVKKTLNKEKMQRKIKSSESDSSKECENDYIEMRKYKHKHKKRKHSSKRYGINTDNSESESSYQIYKYTDEDRRKHCQRKKEKNFSKTFKEKEFEKLTSKWEEEDLHNETRIKSEQISDIECDNNNEDTNLLNRQNSNIKDSQKEQRKNWGGITIDDKKPKMESENKEKVNFGLSGKLTEDSNTYNGVLIKYCQPPEARKPKRRWRWYIFKGEDELPFLPLHRQSAYLIGRERKVADIPTDHPSCSKQHAVFQYRLVSYDRIDGTKGRTVKPYIIDLESANGTYVNNRRIDSKKYIELLEKDVVKFGYSSREYVLLHESSKDSDADLPDTGADMSPFSLLRSQ